MNKSLCDGRYCDIKSLENKIKSENSYVIYLDETGDERLLEPANPYFGYGGIALFGGRSHNHLRSDWRKFKRNSTGDATGKIHAASFDFQRNEFSLRKFFSKNFIRFYICMHRDFTNLNKNTVMTVLLENLFFKFLYPALKSTPEIIVVLEDCERNRKIIDDSVEFMEQNHSWWDKVSVSIVNKNHENDFMEIADFVANAGGNHSRELLKRSEENSLGLTLKCDIVFGSNQKRSCFEVLTDPHLKINSDMG